MRSSAWRVSLLLVLAAFSAIYFIALPELLNAEKPIFNLGEFFEDSELKSRPGLFWHSVAILVIFCLQPELRDILRKISKVQFGGFSLEIQKQTEKNRHNVHYVYGKLFANERKWDQAADMFVKMRRAGNMQDRISGWLASAELLVELVDAETTLTNGQANETDKIEYLRKAEAFCDYAIRRASYLESESKENRTVAAYYLRAIVRSRRVALKDANYNDVVEDVTEAVRLDGKEYLRQITFDPGLKQLMQDKDIKLSFANSVRYSVGSQEKKLKAEFMGVPD